MAEENALENQPAQSIPERPKEAPVEGAPAAEGEKGPSKNALKKLQKEKEKVRPGDTSD